MNTHTHTHTPQTNQNPRNTSVGKYRGWLKARSSKNEKQWANSCNSKLSSYIILTEASYLNPIRSKTKHTSISTYEVLYPQYVTHNIFTQQKPDIQPFLHLIAGSTIITVKGHFYMLTFFLLYELFSAKFF